MKREEFKKLIKESVREALVEEGILSTIVSEVLKGTHGVAKTVVEAKRQAPSAPKVDEKEMLAHREEGRKKLMETRKKMLDAIGNDGFNGVDLFEGTTPLNKGGNPNSDAAPTSPLGDVDPGDPGVDISSLLGNTNVWKQMIG